MSNRSASGKPLPRKKRVLNRGFLYSRKKDDVKNPEVTLLDIDSAITFYFDNVIKPSVEDNGENIKVAKLESGDVVGEMSIIDPKKASATARIVSEEAQLWEISADDFNEFLLADLNEGFEILKELAKMLCKRLRTYNERMLHSMYDERNHYLEQDY